MFIFIQKRFPTFAILSFLFHGTSAHVLMSFQVKFPIKLPATIWTSIRPIFCMCHIMFFELRLIRKPFPTFAAIVFTSPLSTFLLQLCFIFCLFFDVLWESAAWKFHQTRLKTHNKYKHVLNYGIKILHMVLDARKPVFGVCEQQRCRQACAFTQSYHPFVVCLLESIISKLATSEISIF